MGRVLNSILNGSMVRTVHGLKIMHGFKWFSGLNGSLVERFKLPKVSSGARVSSTSSRAQMVQGLN